MPALDLALRLRLVRHTADIGHAAPPVLVLHYEPNGVVAPVHPKAMPVLLTTTEEWRTWFEAPTEVAMDLQGALPDDEMTEGQRRDGMPGE